MSRWVDVGALDEMKFPDDYQMADGDQILVAMEAPFGRPGIFKMIDLNRSQQISLEDLPQPHCRRTEQ